MSEFLLLFLLFVCLLLLLFSLLLFWVGIIHAACTNTLPPSPVTQDRPFRMPEVRKGGWVENAGRLPSEEDTAPPPSHLGGVH